MRRLGPEDRAGAAAIAREAFRGNRFYHRALGLDEDAFAAYWDEFMALALKDPGARVFGAEWRGTLCGVLVAARHEFPQAGAAAVFLLTLARRIGPRGLARYLCFVGAYERAMRRPRAECRLEARGLWLMASPRAAVRVGPSLMRAAVAAMRDEGCVLYTGFVDADNEALLAFYRRLYFVPGRCFRFAGGWAVIVERREVSSPARQGALPC
ncbi:MAG: hypothetical protein HZB25_04050 [Candidatus Eisenbacteria bacterium]|nr:hypothetical protein [Candidatus Eisenbacteria bacterium]